MSEIYGWTDNFHLGGGGVMSELYGWAMGKFWVFFEGTFFSKLYRLQGLFRNIKENNFLLFFFSKQVVSPVSFNPENDSFFRPNSKIIFLQFGLWKNKRFKAAIVSNGCRDRPYKICLGTLRKVNAFLSIFCNCSSMSVEQFFVDWIHPMLDIRRFFMLVLVVSSLRLGKSCKKITKFDTIFRRNS
jgi:hypothetical protein